MKFIKNLLKILLTIVVGTGGIYLIVTGLSEILPEMLWYIKVIIGLLLIGIGIPILIKLKLKK